MAILNYTTKINPENTISEIQKIKDWIEAQMAIVEAGLASVPEVFLPYSITRTNQTLFEYMNTEQGTKLLQESN